MYLFLFVLSGVPSLVAYWALASMYGACKNLKVSISRGISKSRTRSSLGCTRERTKFPYRSSTMRTMTARMNSRVCPSLSCPILTFDFCTGDMFDILEQRHDWAKFSFTPELFKHVFTKLIPSHSREQEQDQVQDHYDRDDDFYGWYISPHLDLLTS
ncbi:uncharacterized protein EV420DRAFT_1100122 [Desarmillaria tabescens]|uniref:Uncharacterized protein n=1 Tax=Armillaria tabescens TaxID=1929756 RepID=A0AA39TZ74_ARMTA|nr:uncharacterized protein EV420DRAFT_1100122 [Desarmillaria tabescens]KAK0463635.1 hypothetical protein EV420DRAFT_1100122 [Desarmillaria tabescens]